MPTKDQLFDIWETELNNPELRRRDDPMYRAPKVIDNTNKGSVQDFLTKLAKSENEEIKPVKLWELVKTIEEQAEDAKKNDHSELVATLVVNFSDCNKGRNPVLINSDDKPLTMLIKVLEYYLSENDKLKKLLAINNE